MSGRAANGESTIYQDADGRWHGYVSVGFTLTGKPGRRHGTGKTRAVVVAKVRDLERKRDAGTINAVSTPTVGWWLEHWLTTIAPRRVRQRTLESYESVVRRHLIPGIGRHRLDRLRPEHLDQLYTALLDDGYSPASVLRHHRILSRALTVAVQRGHVARNVATLVDPPAERQSDLATALDLDEARAVLEAAATVRNSARWAVALALGLRQSEALALQWKDIDLLDNTLTVRRSIHRVRGEGLIYEEPKSKRSHRTLALHYRSSPSCTGTRQSSSASGCWPAPSGTTRTSSSPSPTGGRSTRRPTTTTGRVCCSPPASGTSGCTTAGTR